MDFVVGYPPLPVFLFQSVSVCGGAQAGFIKSTMHLDLGIRFPFDSRDIENEASSSSSFVEDAFARIGIARRNFAHGRRMAGETHQERFGGIVPPGPNPEIIRACLLLLSRAIMAELPPEHGLPDIIGLCLARFIGGKQKSKRAKKDGRNEECFARDSRMAGKA